MFGAWKPLKVSTRDVHSLSLGLISRQQVKVKHIGQQGTGRTDGRRTDRRTDIEGGGLMGRTDGRTTLREED